MGCGSSIIALDSDSDSASTNRQSAQRTNPTSDSNLTPSSPPNNGGPRRMSKQQQQQQQSSSVVVHSTTTPTPHDGGETLGETSKNSRGVVKNPLVGRSSSFENATTTPPQQQQQMQSSSNTGTANARTTAINATNNTAKKKKKPQSKSAEAILSSFFEWKGTGGDYVCRPALAASVAEWVDECEQQFFVEYASRVSAQRHFFYQLKQSEPHVAALYQANMSTNLPVYHSSNSLHHNNNNHQNQQLQQQQQLLLQQSTLQTSPSDPSMMLAATTAHGGGGATTGNSGTVAEKTSSSTIGGGGGGGGAAGSQSTSRMSLASKEHHPLYHQQQQQQQQQQQFPQQVTSSSSLSAVGAPIPSTLAELPLAVRLSEGYRPISADSFMYLYASPDDACDEDDDDDATEAGREEADEDGHAGGDSAPVSPEPQLQHQRMPHVAAHADDNDDDQRVEFASSAAPVTSCAITPEIFPSDSRATADGICGGGVGLGGNLWTSNTSRPSHSYFHLPLSATEPNPASFGLYPQAGTTSRANLPSSGATGGSGFYLHPPGAGAGGGGLVGAAVGSGVGPSSHQQGLRLRSRHDDDDEVPAGTLTRAQSGGSIRGGVVVGGTAAGMMFNPNHHLLYNSDVHSTRSSRGGAGTHVGAHSMSANYSSGLGTVGQLGSVSEFFGAEDPNNQLPPAASSNHHATAPPLPLLPQQETGGVDATHNNNNDNRPRPFPIPASGAFFGGDTAAATGGAGGVEYDPCGLLLNGSSHSGGSNNQFLGELGSNHSAGGVVMVPAAGGGGGLFDLHPHDEVLAPPPLLPGTEGGYYGVRMGKIGGMRTGHSTRSRGSSVTSEGSRDSAGGGRMMSPWDSSLPSGQALFSYTPTAAAHPAPAQ